MRSTEMEGKNDDGGNQAKDATSTECLSHHIKAAIPYNFTNRDTVVSSSPLLYIVKELVEPSVIRPTRVYTKPTHSSCMHGEPDLALLD